MKSIIQRSHQWLKKHRFVRMIVIFLLVVLVVLEVDAIVRGLRDPYLADDLSLQYEHGRLIRHRDLASPDEIEPWMTFQYVNFIFSLSDEYLKERLGIEDGRYPKVQIGGYARRTGLPLEPYLALVKQAIAAYPAGVH